METRIQMPTGRQKNRTKSCSFNNLFRIQYSQAVESPTTFLKGRAIKTVKNRKIQIQFLFQQSSS